MSHRRPSSFRRRFGGRLRALRYEAKLTQEALAEALDVSKGQISQYESGIAVPSLDKLTALASRLSVEVFELFLLDVREPRAALAEAVRRGDRAAAVEAIQKLVP